MSTMRRTRLASDAALDEEVHQPAADGQFAHGGDEPGHAGVEKRMQQVDVQREGEVAGQPGEQQIKDVVVGAKAQRQPEHFALAQQPPQRGCRLIAVCPLPRSRACDVAAFRFGQSGIFVRIAIDAPEIDKVQQADGAGQRQSPSAIRPAAARMPTSGMPMTEENLAAESNSAVGRLRSCGGNQLAHRLGAGREGRRFANAEQKPRAEQRAERGRQRAAKGRHAPQAGARTTYAAHAEFVEHDADGQLAKPVGQVVGAGEIAECDVGNAERRDQRAVRGGEVDAVEVADQDADAEQPRDAPAAPRNASCNCNASGSMSLVRRSTGRPAPRYFRACRSDRW